MSAHLKMIAHVDAVYMQTVKTNDVLVYAYLFLFFVCDYVCFMMCRCIISVSCRFILDHFTSICRMLKQEGNFVL